MTLIPVASYMHTAGGTLVCSFPRSGSTLTRSIIASGLRDKFPKLAGAPVTEIFPNLSDEFDPAALHGAPLFARTHDHARISEFRTIYWFRRPDDCLHSYYAWLSRKNKFTMPPFEKFVGRASETWKDDVRTALARHKESPSEISINDYSDYLKAPTQVIGRILAFGGLDLGAHLETIVDMENRRFRAGIHAQPDAFQTQRGVEGHTSSAYSGPHAARALVGMMEVYEEARSAARQAQMAI